MSEQTGPSADDTDRPRPAYKRGLLEKAKEAEEPVTEVDVSKSGHVTRVHAIQEYDGVAYRAQITYDERSDSPPRVKFGRSRWDSEVGVLADWSSLATGSLPGPQNLPAWESLFTVFNSALGLFNREVRGDPRTLDTETERDEEASDV